MREQTVDTIRPHVNTPGQVLFASLIGTTIEFFDFYIYATAAVIVFPKLFFPASDATSATLNSLATFALAFFARPLGSAIFGHFGDRIGRKATLVAALLTMGVSTVIIGVLPTYQSIGVAAPALLALCRFGQGLGLGGEWGGAVLLATENAPPGRRAWFGMFPQQGAPLGYILSAASFLVLSAMLTDAQFLAFGWRIPFLISAALVLVGLYVRLKLTETPAFLRAIENNERVKVPMSAVFSRHAMALVLGMFAALVAFVLFYLITVFALSWAIRELKYDRTSFLIQQMICASLFAAGIVMASLAADRWGARIVSMAVAAMTRSAVEIPRWLARQRLPRSPARRAIDSSSGIQLNVPSRRSVRRRSPLRTPRSTSTRVISEAAGTDSSERAKSSAGR